MLVLTYLNYQQLQSEHASVSTDWLSTSHIKKESKYVSISKVKLASGHVKTESTNNILTALLSTSYIKKIQRWSKTKKVLASHLIFFLH